MFCVILCEINNKTVTLGTGEYKHQHKVVEPTLCTFIYQRLPCVLASISGHPQEALVLTKVCYLCTYSVLLVVLYCQT